MTKTVLLIDGDQYLYKACAACESETRWDDENHVLASNEVEAWDTVVGSLKKVFDHFGTKDHVLAFTGSTYFRRDLVDPSYKMNRAGTRKPLCFWSVRERIFAAYKCVVIEGLEADDVMGILSTKPGDTHRIIVARDKDMKTIPGKLWDGYKFFNVTEEEADRFHLYQTLVGDVSDGYKGCPGIGPKKADALLDHAAKGAAEGYDYTQKYVRPPDQPKLVPPWAYTQGRMWANVCTAFVKAGLTPDDALRQARLARILRWSDWDSTNKKPILWTPKTT